MSDGKVVISTALDNSGFEKGLNNISGSLGGLKGVLGKLTGVIATAFSVAKIVQFGTESSKAARQLQDALTGLKSVVDGYGRSFSNAKKFIKEYTSDGLIPATNATAAYKNLLSRGYDDSQIRSVMNALKDASAYGRQSSYTMGEAVQSATEGLKNENSVLVDNAGVTKNVAKMWDDYAKSIGTTAAKLTQQQKIQAEVTGILEESKFQTGDAAKVSGTLSGQLQQLSFNFNNLKVAIGNAINPILQAVLPSINAAIAGFTTLANSIASVMGALFGSAKIVSSAATGVSEVADAYAGIAESAAAGAAAQKDLAKGVSAAEKAAKKSLAGFDELNTLQDKMSSGGSGGPGDDGISTGGSSSVGTVEVTSEVVDTLSPKLQTVIDKINELVVPLKEIDFAPAAEAFERLKQAIEPITRKMFDGLEWAWYNILVPLAKWTIEDALPAFLDLVSASLDVLNVAIEGLQPLGGWLWDEFLKPMAEWTGGAIVDIINGFADALARISDWISKNQEGVNNFLILLGSVAGAFAAVEMVAQIVTYISAVSAMAPEVGLLAAAFPALSSAIATVGTFITGTLIPGISTALAAIAGALGISVGWVAAIVAAVGAAVAAIIIYWDEIVAALETAWNKIKEIWAVVSGWFDENVIQPTAEFFTELWESVSEWASAAWEQIKKFFTPAVQWFSALLDSIGQTFSTIFHNIGVIASGCWEIIKAVWGIVASWFSTYVIQPVSGFFSDLWAGFTSAAAQAWAAVKEIFGKVASFFKEVFSDAWEGVVSVFSIAGDIFVDIKDGILTAFKAVVNGIIRGLNSAISIPFSGINTAIRRIRNANILGISPFSGLQTISVPQIPYLARGAVLPANKPFLAVVGDQRHGTNVEAPLSTIQEAVAAVMEDMVASNMAGHEATVAVLQEILSAVLGIEIGDTVIGEAADRYNHQMAIMRGGF